MFNFTHITLKGIPDLSQIKHIRKYLKDWRLIIRGLFQFCKVSTFQRRQSFNRHLIYNLFLHRHLAAQLWSLKLLSLQKKRKKEYSNTASTDQGYYKVINQN